MWFGRAGGSLLPFGWGRCGQGPVGRRLEASAPGGELEEGALSGFVEIYHLGDLATSRQADREGAPKMEL
jgi:hypothetical protein